VTNLILVTRFLLLLSEFEMFCSFQGQMFLCLALLALKSKNYLTCSLGFLVEYWLCLSTETHLLGVITTLSLSKVGCLPRFVLSDLVYLVLFALASSAVSSSLFRYVDHFKFNCNPLRMIVCQSQNG